MPHIMEFYGLDWSDLGKTLGSGDRDLVDRVDQENGDNFFRSAEDQENRLVWRKILEALICGRRGKALAARGPEPNIQPEAASDIAALALAAMVRTLGTGIGELEHSTSSGSFFREEFLEREAPRLLKSSVVLTQLINRPLFGLVHEETYPSWGGLKKAEVRLLLENRAGDGIPSADDSDVEAWLYDLCTCLQAAHEDGSDIVTVYS